MFRDESAKFGTEDFTTFAFGLYGTKVQTQEAAIASARRAVVPTNPKAR